MKKKNSYPDWYWVYGLHDANIVHAKIKKSDWNPADDCLILEIDCKGALYEADITQIRFFDFKITNAPFDLNLLTGGWWLYDELIQKDGRYLLELEFDTKECKRKILKINFKKAEVIRSNLSYTN